MVRTRDVEALPPWIADTVGSLLAPFGRGIRADGAAVRAALTQSWSNGQTEGQITKLKLVKRQMYGASSSTCYAPGCSPRHDLAATAPGLSQSPSSTPNHTHATSAPWSERLCDEEDSDHEHDGDDGQRSATEEVERGTARVRANRGSVPDSASCSADIAVDQNILPPIYDRFRRDGARQAAVVRMHGNR